MNPAEWQEHLLGWELPAALEYCAEYDVTTHIVVTAPPQRGDQLDTVHLAGQDEPNYRVVAVRAGTSDSLVLVVSAEKW